MLLHYNCKHVSVGPSPTPAVVDHPTKRSGILSAKNGQFLAVFGRKLIFFCAGGPATPDMLLQYNCKNFSVGPSPTPAVVNYPTKRLCILSAKNWQFMAIFWRKLIFFRAGGPATPDMLLQYNCKHVSVGPSPTFAVVKHLTKSSCNLSAKNGKFLAVFGRKLIFLCADGPATPDMLLQYNCKHVSVGPSPTPAVVNYPTKRSCILWAKNGQFMAIFWRKLIFFRAGGPATLDMLLQYNCKHVSVGPSLTPAVVNHPTKRSCNLSAKNGQFLAIFWPKLIFFCAGGPATPDRLLQYNCKHVSVGPSPTLAVVNYPTKRSCILPAKNGQLLAISWRKLFSLCWRPCSPRYVARIQLETRFSGSVPDPGGCQ